MCTPECLKNKVARMAGGAAGLAKAAVAQTTGIGAVTPEVRQARLDVCRTCEESTKNPDPKFAKSNGLSNFSICKQCTCILSQKTWIASEACPLGKWKSDKSE